MIRDFYEMAVNTPSDINELLGLLRDAASQCMHVTELGVRGMVSTWAFLFGVPKGGKVVSIDIVDPKEFGGNVKNAEVLAESEGKKFEFILGSSLEVDIEPTDFLFLDTIHTKEQVKAELERHHSKARKFIGFHDTESCPEIQDSIYGFLGEHPEWRKLLEYTENNGLILLKRYG